MRDGNQAGGNKRIMESRAPRWPAFDRFYWYMGVTMGKAIPANVRYEHIRKEVRIQPEITE